jgi:hypothetical protein
MTVISTYFKEDAGFRARAEVVKEGSDYKMKLYDPEGNFVSEKSFPGKSIHYVESAAENWTMGFQVL